MNPHGASPCNVDDLDIAKCWAASPTRAKKILLGSPRLGLEKGLLCAGPSWL